MVRLRAELRDGDATVIVRDEANDLFESSYDKTKFDSWCDWLRNQTHGSAREGRHSRFRDKLDEIADQVSGIVNITTLSEQIKEVSAEVKTAYVCIEIRDRELDAIPWELLARVVEKRLGVHNVCIYRSTTVGVSKITLPTPPQRVLLIESSPLSKQSVNFAKEARSIRQQLSGLQIAGIVQLELCMDADHSDLDTAFKTPARVSHIAAQGTAGSVTLSVGSRHVDFDSEAFAEIIKQSLRPAAVVLSICDSAQGVPERPALVRAVANTGVANVLGMYSAITPQAALTFFESLYRALGRCTNMITAYAEATVALRSSSYPDYGFWSVPVLYSQSNIIPFPGTHGDPEGRYRRAANEVSEFKSQVSAVRPQENTSAIKWRDQTMYLRLNASRIQRQLDELIQLVQPERRAGSQWAEDVDRTAKAGLHAFNRIVEQASGGTLVANSAARFTQSKNDLLNALGKLDRIISARIRFSS